MDHYVLGLCTHHITLISYIASCDCEYGVELQLVLLSMHITLHSSAYCKLLLTSESLYMALIYVLCVEIAFK